MRLEKPSLKYIGNCEHLFCSDIETTLNVHHLKYNGEPWEADSNDLITTCEDCHRLIEAIKLDTPDYHVNKVHKRFHKLNNELFYFVKFTDKEAVYIITLHDNLKINTCVGLTGEAIEELNKLRKV